MEVKLKVIGTGAFSETLVRQIEIPNSVEVID
jgi:hypothetical protein